MLNRRHFTVAACCAFHMFATARAEELPTSFICTTREPKSDGFSITHHAATQQGRNAIARAETFKFTPFGLASLADRWRPEDSLTPDSKKITLGVAFIEGSADQKKAVQEIASEWLIGDAGQALAFDFSAPVERAQIRIGFLPGIGSFSVVGRGAKDVPASRRTMNLAVVDRRTILHEFGHAFGLRHEHHHPEMAIVWDEKRVISEMTARGWSEAEIKRNILDRAPKADVCVGDPAPNHDSIMLYPIPAEWTKNGFSSRQTKEISPNDRRCVEGLYPPA